MKSHNGTPFKRPLRTRPLAVCVGDVLNKASRYALRASRSVVVSLSLSQRYAASESEKKDCA